MAGAIPAHGGRVPLLVDQAPVSAWSAIRWAIGADWRDLLERFTLLLAAYVVGAVLGGFIWQAADLVRTWIVG